MKDESLLALRKKKNYLDVWANDDLTLKTLGKTLCICTKKRWTEWIFEEKNLKAKFENSQEKIEKIFESQKKKVMDLFKQLNPVKTESRSENFQMKKFHKILKKIQIEDF